MSTSFWIDTLNTAKSNPSYSIYRRIIRRIDPVQELQTGLMSPFFIADCQPIQLQLDPSVQKLPTLSNVALFSSRESTTSLMITSFRPLRLPENLHLNWISISDKLHCELIISLTSYHIHQVSAFDGLEINGKQERLSDLTIDEITLLEKRRDLATHMKDPDFSGNYVRSSQRHIAFWARLRTMNLTYMKHSTLKVDTNMWAYMKFLYYTKTKDILKYVSPPGKGIL